MCTPWLECKGKGKTLSACRIHKHEALGMCLIWDPQIV